MHKSRFGFAINFDTFWDAEGSWIIKYVFSETSLCFRRKKKERERMR